MNDFLRRDRFFRYLDIEFQYPLPETKERLRSIIDEEIMFDTNQENKKKNLSGKVHDLGLDFSSKSHFFQSALAPINLVRASGTFLDQGSSIVVKMRIEPRIRFYLLIFVGALIVVTSLIFLLVAQKDSNRFIPFMIVILGAAIIIRHISVLRDGQSAMIRLIDSEFKNIKRVPPHHFIA